MKANAPEKLYISDYGSEVRYNWHPERLAVKDIEYIRKDAFIEKVCRWLQKEVVNDYEGLIWENLIDDFKKYMKGEYCENKVQRN